MMKSHEKHINLKNATYHLDHLPLGLSLIYHLIVGPFLEKYWITWTSPVDSVNKYKYLKVQQKSSLFLCFDREDQCLLLDNYSVD